MNTSNQNTNKIYAYVRVSSKDQNLDRQLTAIKEYCIINNLTITDRDIIKDKSSGKNFNRDGYQLLINHFLRKGDTLLIKELDRLGRDMAMIKIEWNNLIKNGINIIVIDTPILNTANKTDLEKSLISNIVFELLSYLAEKERIKIKERQKEGIKIAHEKGTKFGRPPIQFPSNFEVVYTQWKSNEITAKIAMELLSLKRTSFYKLIKLYESNN